MWCVTAQREKPNASKEVSQDDVLIAIDTETHLNPAQQANYVLIAFEIQ